MKKGIILLCTLCALFYGCKKNGDGYTTDPNTVTDVPLKLLLPPAEVAVTLVHSTELAWYSAVFMQQQAGVDRQMASADKYLVQEADMNRPWNSAYTAALNNLKIIRDKAAVQQAPAYSGIARILTAMTLGQLTDAFGDIPYSQAFQQSANTKPAYDAQEAIYATIQSLLSEAIADLEAPSALVPAGDDLIYNGDLSLWKKTAHVLKARYHNHLSKRDAAGSATATLADLDAGGYSNNGDDAQLAFGATQTQANPWYQFVNQRGDVRMGAYLLDFMKATNDPRLPFYAAKDDAGGYSGSRAGTPLLSASKMGALFASIDSKVPLATYTEQKFIEAEAALRGGDRSRAATAFNNAVMASLAKSSASGAAFISAYGSETATTISLQKVMQQKYVALFTQAEVWTDYRRTGYPQLQPAANNYSGGITPRRLPYPLDERNYNGGNVPSGVSLGSRVWWDE